MQFYGQAHEVEALNLELRLSERYSRLAVITGRRGSGKTALVLKTVAGCGRPTLYFLCRRQYAQEELARLWMSEIRTTFGLREDDGPRRLTLANVIKFVMTLSRECPAIMILEDCQELDHVAPTFWGDLQGVWDLGKDDSRLLLVMIGSPVAAIHAIFADAGEPLFGRLDLLMTVRPFSPVVLREVFLDSNPKGTPDDLLTLYAVTGGTARHVSHLAQNAPLTRTGIVNHIFSEDGDFLRAEGDALLARDFRTQSPTCERILRALARGTATRTDIVDQLQGADIATDMDRLEKRFRLVRKVEPLFSRHPGVIRHEITDPYFRFWFRFIEPAQYQSLAERGNWEALRSICMNALDQYTERTLKDWYRNLFGGNPHWTQTGRWWDRKGANEIDLIAMNELTNAFMIFEIKRNADKIKHDVLALKAKAFLEACRPALKKYPEPLIRGLSLDTLLHDPAEL